MIHQFIFASPKPGLTEQEFLNYWQNVHAVDYAAKIPQIRKYMIDARLPLPGEEGEPLWSGVAEIWLRNDEEQLASIQTPEFLDGARVDEPRWAAFWKTLALDTDPHQIWDTGVVNGTPGVKILLLAKRREGLALDEFRRALLADHSELVRAVPGLQRYVLGTVRDGLYAVGEAPLDAVLQITFSKADDLIAARRSPEWAALEDGLKEIAETRYVHELAVRENWIIGPSER